MGPGKLGSLVEESSSKLFRMSFPPVRHWLLKQVMEKDERDAKLRDCIAACDNYRPKIRLLEKLRPDGTWPIPSTKQGVEDAGPGPPVGWTYRVVLWNLLTLSEYNTSRNEGHVNEALQRMLKWQNKEGYIPGPWTDAFPLPHFNGIALYNLIWYGLEKNPNVQKLIRWLLSEQRPDGGWIIPYMMDIHRLPEYNWMRMWNFIDFIRASDKSKMDRASLSHVPSCHWSTLLAIWGLSESKQQSRSRQVMKGAELVLDRFFKKNPHSTYYMTDAHWTKLRHPARFGSGLMALDLLTKLGYGPDDPRMEKPISWLLGARSADGLWNYSQRPRPEKDQWISLIALRTLHRYSKNR
jgi:hypothetical protein